MRTLFSRPNLAFLHDIAMAAISFVLSLFLRLGDGIAFYPQDQLVLALAVFIVVSAVVFRAMRMYRGIWRYASLNDLFNIAKSASLVVLVFTVLLFTVTRLDDLPRSLPIINWFVLIALLGGPRFLYRLFKDRRLDFKLDRDAHLRVPILLVGDGDNAELFIRDVARGTSNYRIVGIVSETEGRVGRDIHGVEILGTIDQVPEVIETLSRRGDGPQRIVVSSEHMPGSSVSSLLDTAESLGMSLARLPSLSDFRSNLEDGITVKPIEVEDLLGRPQKPMDRTKLKSLIDGRRVLVTGAGGSIGSELVRQIAALGPAHMSLVDSSEYNLFTIDRELGKDYPELSRSALIGDVRNQGRVENILSSEKPNLVFHAAALKHVPLVEANVFEGLATNVQGTVNMANAARKEGVSTFVQISTDKAVNPTSIMGVAKRIAEIYCQALDKNSSDGNKIRFVTVRFGNVLGSTGSVVELFRDQLREGGPITVTHPDMVRYFMTIRESVELVLQASALGTIDEEKTGKILVLDMGEPVRILDLAKQMIRLAGFTPDEDIKIEFIGPRPGEKLFEELLHSGEKLEPTAQEGIFQASPRISDLQTAIKNIEALNEACKKSDLGGALAVIKEMVPEYAPPGESAATRPAVAK
ncbi:MAG: polysaccharide biosynthesis protein [Rhodospirillales bacterium]|nr:polysaccharide biosynthesis protein [Rhodospirillales bacterium]